MKILVTGTHGQVGFELLEALKPLGQVIAVDRTRCDLLDQNALRALVRESKPDVIVNPAAYTAVDKAQSEPALAFGVNHLAPKILGEEAARLGALVIHYSTDYVFDGTKSAPYSEQDTPNPQSIYGESKWQGEQALALAHPKHLILRTSWVVGAHGNNFAKTMLRLAAERDTLTVVADQWGAPTSARLLATHTAQLISQYAATPDRFKVGTYHLTAAGETNWCEYARFVVREATNASRTLKATAHSIAPIATSDYPTPAKRPANSRLSTAHYQDTFHLVPEPWEVGVRDVLHTLWNT
jgi:dTDP-4-dehydrorhamnose reductase